MDGTQTRPDQTRLKLDLALSVPIAHKQAASVANRVLVGACVVTQALAWRHSQVYCLPARRLAFATKPGRRNRPVYELRNSFLKSSLGT